MARKGKTSKTEAKLEIFRQKEAMFEGFSEFCLTWFFYPYLLLGSDWNRRKEALKHLRGSLLLDAGSGSGWFSVEAYNKGFNVVSIDISSKSNKSAKTLMDIEGVKIPLLRASLTNLPFKNDTFDSVACFEVIEHIENVNAVFSEFRRTLKKGGKLLITAPNGFGASGIIQDFVLPKIGLVRHGVEPYHVHRFTEAFLRQIISQKGFQINRFYNAELLGPIFMAFFLMIKKFCKHEPLSILKLLYPDVVMAKHVPRRLAATWIINCKKNQRINATLPQGILNY